jgi:hypothetical protein
MFGWIIFRHTTLKRYETNFMVSAEQMSTDFNERKYIAFRSNGCDDEVLFHFFTNCFTSYAVDRATDVTPGSSWITPSFLFGTQTCTTGC